MIKLNNIMQKNTLIIAIFITLVVGISAGYMIGVNKEKSTAKEEILPMAHVMDSMSAELNGKKGDDFDKAFLTEMIIHHQGAIEMAELAITNAKHQEIKDLADAIVAAQKREVGQMIEWQRGWYK